MQFPTPNPFRLFFDLTPLCRSAHEDDTSQASALVTLPDATSPDAFIKWAKSLPAGNPPTWLGLAPNAEAALLATRGEQLLSTWQVTDCVGQLTLKCFVCVRCDSNGESMAGPCSIFLLEKVDVHHAYGGPEDRQDRTTRAQHATNIHRRPFRFRMIAAPVTTAADSGRR